MESVYSKVTKAIIIFILMECLMFVFFENGRFYFAEPIDDLMKWILNHWCVKDIETFQAFLINNNNAPTPKAT